MYPSPHNPVFPRCLDPSVIGFSLSWYGQIFIYFLFTSRCIDYDKHTLHSFTISSQRWQTSVTMTHLDFGGNFYFKDQTIVQFCFGTDGSTDICVYIYILTLSLSNTLHLLYMCVHTVICVLNTTIYVSSYCYICVLNGTIYICPHTYTCVSSYCSIYVSDTYTVTIVCSEWSYCCIYQMVLKPLICVTKTAS